MHLLVVPDARGWPAAVNAHATKRPRAPPTADLASAMTPTTFWATACQRRAWACACTCARERSAAFKSDPGAERQGDAGRAASMAVARKVTPRGRAAEGLGARRVRAGVNADCTQQRPEFGAPRKAAALLRLELCAPTRSNDASAAAQCRVAPALSASRGDGFSRWTGESCCRQGSPLPPRRTRASRPAER